MTTTTEDQSLPSPDHTINQAAHQLSATSYIVREAIKKGLLKSYKISPRNTRITQEALDEFRNNGRMAS